MTHHTARLAWLVVAAIALGGVADAQNVPEQFVVSGKAAEKIQDFTTINLATAERIAETCERLVTAQGDGQHSIMVLDNDGNHVYFDRMDGQGYHQHRDARNEGPHRASDARTEQGLIQNLVAQDPRGSL